jgi:hypothetical protein
MNRGGPPLLARVGECLALTIGFHQRLEHAAALGTGVVGIGAVVRSRLFGSQAAESRLDGSDDALRDDLGRESVERTLKRIAGIDVLAEDPGLAVLPVNVVAEQQTVHLVNVRVVGEHDVPGHIEREAGILD